MKKLSKHLWAMDVLEEKMKDEIARQKQITDTTEKSIKEVEKDKKKQDMVIGPSSYANISCRKGRGS